MNLAVTETSILAWGMTFCGLALGLVIAAFVVENTYTATPWHCVLLVVVAATSVIRNSIKSRYHGR